MFNKSTRSYFFRGLVALHRGPLSWREARLMFKGATCAAIYRHKQSDSCRGFIAGDSFFGQDSETYRRDMMEAGRGHLLR